MRKLLLFCLLAGSLGLMAMACGGGGGSKKVALGSLSATDKGTKDVSALSEIELEADDYYFNPTFLKGSPGQKLKITVDNESKTLHNFSVPALALDKDVEAGKDAGFDLTFPSSGVLLFLCKYHTAQGMNGELLSGDASPQAASATVA